MNIDSSILPSTDRRRPRVRLLVSLPLAASFLLVPFSSCAGRPGGTQVADPGEAEGDGRQAANKALNEGCLSCHRELRRHLYQASSHPLGEGGMSCAACHEPHASEADAQRAAPAARGACVECHREKKGPFLFEHASVREMCVHCHDPHGSINPMLLVEEPPRLCRGCHAYGHHQSVPGLSPNVWNEERSCLKCHRRIHGSNDPGGAIFER